jgi:hypothetical protein
MQDCSGSTQGHRRGHATLSTDRRSVQCWDHTPPKPSCHQALRVQVGGSTGSRETRARAVTFRLAPHLRVLPQSRPGPRAVRRVEPKAGGLPAPISLRLPPDCWWFIQIVRSSPTSIPLPDDVLDALSRAPGVEFASPIPEPRLVVHLTRPQAEALLRWLQAPLDELSREDERWLTCLHCISRLTVAIRSSET